MSVEKKIEHTLSDNFDLSHLEVINESHMHSGPNTESHFKVILVTDEFEDMKLKLFLLSKYLISSLESSTKNSISSRFKQLSINSLNFFSEFEETIYSFLLF